MATATNRSDKTLGDLKTILGESDITAKSLRDLVIDAMRQGFLSLEDIVLIAYRQGLLSRGKVGEILGLSFQAREDLLKESGVPYNYDIEDFEKDERAVADFHSSSQAELESGHETFVQITGEIRVNFLEIKPGDSVEVKIKPRDSVEIELSYYDPTLGNVIRLQNESDKMIQIKLQNNLFNQESYQTRTDQERVTSRLLNIVTKEEAERWLNAVNSSLNGDSPATLINRGRTDEVLQLIAAVEEGNHW